jgi:His/Glu/Gln/Arg/opine family amino acid ABC transporter permease subunit
VIGFGELLVHPLIIKAAWLTIWVAIVSQLVAIVLGLPIALAQLSGNPVLRGAAWTYNWLFQGTPLLMQLVFFWAILPLMGVRLDVILSGILGLVLHETARMSQIIRAAVGGVDWRQAEAARSLGMSGWQVLRLITGPQALRIALPPTGNEFNYQFKATSLLAAIGIVELTRQTMVFTDRDPANPLPYFAVAALYYLAMSTGWQLLQDRIERRLARRGFADRAEVQIRVGA